MIYTVTFNPALDYVVRLSDLVPGDVNRTDSEDIQLGGKGINVSCVLGQLGFESVDALKEEISSSITQQKEQVIPQIKENSCALELVKRVEGEAPESLVEQTEAQLLQDFFGQLQRAGMSFDNYLMQQGIDNAEFKEDVKRQAADDAKRELALDAWARHKGIEATDEDVTMEFVRAGLDDPKKTEREWRESGRLYLIREGIIRSKAMADVLETAKVTEVDFADREED